MENHCHQLLLFLYLVHSNQMRLHRHRLLQTLQHMLKVRRRHQDFLGVVKLVEYYHFLLLQGLDLVKNLSNEILHLQNHHHQQVVLHQMIQKFENKLLLHHLKMLWLKI